MKLRGRRRASGNSVPQPAAPAKLRAVRTSLAKLLPPGTSYPPQPAYDALIFNGTVPYVETRPATPGGTTGGSGGVAPVGRRALMSMTAIGSA